MGSGLAQIRSKHAARGCSLADHGRSGQPTCPCLRSLDGAPGLTRTGTPLRETDFESVASTNSATGAPKRGARAGRHSASVSGPERIIAGAARLATGDCCPRDPAGVRRAAHPGRRPAGPLTRISIALTWQTRLNATSVCDDQVVPNWTSVALRLAAEGHKAPRPTPGPGGRRLGRARSRTLMVDGREGSRPPRRKGKNLASRQRDERQVPPVCLHRACESLGMVVTRRFWVPAFKLPGM